MPVHGLTYVLVVIIMDRFVQLLFRKRVAFIFQEIYPLNMKATLKDSCSKRRCLKIVSANSGAIITTILRFGYCPRLSSGFVAKTPLTVNKVTAY